MMRRSLLNWAKVDWQSVKPMGLIQTAVFSKSLPNFICKLFIMKGSISMGQEVKISMLSGRLYRHYKDYRFYQITLKLHMQVGSY